jgi:hypothetical protein
MRVNKDVMVYYSKTLEICHGLTEKGEEEYQKMLEQVADDILFRSKHPFKWFFGRILEFFR